MNISDEQYAQIKEIAENNLAAWRQSNVEEH
jgi:hypothetical protein